MVELSLPPSRVGAGAVPDSIFLMRQMIPSRCLPLAPPSLTLLSRGTSLPPRPWDRQHSSSRGDVPQDLVHIFRLSVSHGSCCNQSVQHSADRAFVHPGSPYPPSCGGVWLVEAAFRPLSQRVAPVTVMFAATSSQEECHSLRRLLSPLGGGPLHPCRRPRDVDRVAGPCGQVTVCWE